MISICGWFMPLWFVTYIFNLYIYKACFFLNDFFQVSGTLLVWHIDQWSPAAWVKVESDSKFHRGNFSLNGCFSLLGRFKEVVGKQQKIETPKRDTLRQWYYIVQYFLRYFEWGVCNFALYFFCITVLFMCNIVMFSECYVIKQYIWHESTWPTISSREETLKHISILESELHRNWVVTPTLIPSPYLGI